MGINRKKPKKVEHKKKKIQSKKSLNKVKIPTKNIQKTNKKESRNNSLKKAGSKKTFAKNKPQNKSRFSIVKNKNPKKKKLVFIKKPKAPAPEDKKPTKEEKIRMIKNEGLFVAFEQILKSYYNGGMKMDTNIFEFAINRLKKFESTFKTEQKKKDRIEKYKKLEKENEQKVKLKNMF